MPGRCRGRRRRPTSWSRCRAVSRTAAVGTRCQPRGGNAARRSPLHGASGRRHGHATQQGGRRRCRARRVAPRCRGREPVPQPSLHGHGDHLRRRLRRCDHPDHQDATASAARERDLRADGRHPPPRAPRPDPHRQPSPPAAGTGTSTWSTTTATGRIGPSANDRRTRPRQPARPSRGRYSAVGSSTG